MKRSELNKIMKDAVEFIEEMNFKLPPLLSGVRRNGRKKVMIMTRSEIIC